MEPLRSELIEYERAVGYRSFIFQGVEVNPKSAYTVTHFYRKHIERVAEELGGIYIEALDLFQDYFRYALYVFKDEDSPDEKIRLAIEEVKKKPNK